MLERSLEELRVKLAKEKRVVVEATMMTVKKLEEFREIIVEYYINDFESFRKEPPKNSPTLTFLNFIQTTILDRSPRMMGLLAKRRMMYGLKLPSFKIFYQDLGM